MATYGIVLFYPDSPSADELMLSHVLTQPVTFIEGLVGSQATAKTAATAETVFSIRHEGVEVATCTFAAAGTTGTYAATAEFVVGTAEVFDIVAPATPDASLADISFTIVGTVEGSGTRPVNLQGEITLSTSCVGRLTFVPSLAGNARTGKTLCNGRLSVDHDLGVFNV